MIRSRFPIVRDDILCPFCVKTAAGSAIVGVIVRTATSKVETLTVLICSGNDPNNGKGLGKYQDDKKEAALDGVFSLSTLPCLIEATWLLFGTCLLFGSCHSHKYEPCLLFGSIVFHNEACVLFGLC